MNLGAFAIIAWLESHGKGQEIEDFNGLATTAPLHAAAMAIFLFSLTGLPPFAGFFGKFYVFYALVARGGTFMVTLAIVGILNSALSLYYYARVLKAMYFDAATDEAPIALSRLHASLLAVLAAPTVALFLVWSPLLRFVDDSLRRW
jgi:NADH-quinone oxidoreductase subunit N